MVIFIHPDYEALIECTDGSNKYPPVTAYEDTSKRISLTFKK